MVAKREIKLEDTWKQVLEEEFAKDYMVSLRQFLLSEKTAGHIVYPPGEEVFAALNTTPFSQAKVVILGQDPYHGEGQAHGLCFSVRPGTDIPPSLRNIYKELHSDTGFTHPGHGYLLEWAKQGVLLLNSVLTVQASKAASHQGKGWERFTDRIVELLNQEKQNLVFLLWGSYAQKKGAMIDRNRHLVLSSPHPSPLSASRGFFGNQHFSKTNNYLQQHGSEPIAWQLGPLT